jgi:hypothetical protein
MSDEYDIDEYDDDDDEYDVADDDDDDDRLHCRYSVWMEWSVNFRRRILSFYQSI